ncbi:SH3 domain-containing protein [Exiguobacterium sp. S22-S28]|uniref:C40 family peptidase n=1 Tax=Exiguobacterium sp. S22-S28 TaxID=3342768 RepID=UPI00372D3EC0
MKKTFLTLTTLALISSATGVEAASTTLILTDNVNIRTAATTSAPVITTLKKGTTVTAVKKTGSWYEIRHQSKKAFITAAYVKAVPAKPTTSTTYITNTSAVNVREKATTTSKSLGKLAKNVSLTVKKKTGDWYEIQYNNKSAYVHTTLVTAKTSTVATGSKPAATTPVTLPVSTAVKAVDTSKQYEVNAKEGLNARLSASATASIYKTLAHKTVLKVTGAVDSWYQVQLDGKNVYVASNYVLATTKEAPTAPGVSVTPVDQTKTYTVNAPTGLNVRTAPSTASTVFTQLAHGSTVQVSGETTGTSAGWYQIKIGTAYYYIAKSYITTGSVTAPVTPPVTPPKPTIPASDIMEKAISIGQQYLGTPYVWGSSSPVNGGFDCSGFINYALNTSGYKVARTNVNGYWNNDGYLGQKLSKLRQPVRGDIIFFENTYAAGPTHIGIMLNNDQFIHANTPSLGISRLSERYWTQKLLGFKAL